MVRSSGRAVGTEQRLIAGRYLVEGLLGKGGMGAVYAVVDQTTGKRLALKSTAHNSSPRALELFKREFHTLHGLRHPNIIEVYDYGSDEGELFYTMELLQGADLGSAAPPLPWRQVCSYLRQIATLLGLLHARRLLHRDVTPRNIWILPDGRLKMIDFGALCPFGTATEVVGTPPFIAPEWLHDRSAGVRIDQRADLYALGALGYWLLTSTHAYRARTMNDLPRVWARAPAPPSSLAKLVENRDLEPIPAELDALVLSLLRRSPSERPETTEALIDQLDTIAGPAREPGDHAVHGYVRSKVFVGRRVERRRLAESFRQHTGAAIAVQAAAGVGRSRLLEELSLQARLAGATSVLVRAEARDRAYDVANRIALGLLTGLPQEAAAAAQPFAGVLAQLSPELQQRLAVTEVARDVTPAGRARLQCALTDWVFAVAAERQLLLSVDDIEQSDEESAAWLSALAPYCSTRKLLLVVALVEEPGVQPALTSQMFCKVAQTWKLAALSADEVRELLQSVFGPATYLERVAESLHRVSHGNAAHCLELVEHLVERGLARYSEGTWILPGHLSAGELPRNRSQMHVARLDQLGQDARRLAALLSIHDGRLSRADCRSLSELPEQETAAALVELTLLGVLAESEQGYGFVHASVREQLAESLTPECRTRAHAQLGASLLASAKDPIDAMRAGLHLFGAGEVERCFELVRSAAMHLLEHREREHVAVPLFAQAVALYRAAQCDESVLAAPLGVLAAESFFVDRRLADRYGEAAIEALEGVLRFDLVRKLTPVMGARLALFSALGAAGLKQRRLGARGLSVANAIRMLAATTIALNGVAASSVDVERTARCRRALEPLAALGDRNIIGMVRGFMAAVGGLLDEKHTATFAKLQAMRALLESDTPIRGLPAQLRREFLGGCLLSIGIMEGWRQSSAMLEIADRIQPIGPMYELNADQLRSMYYYGQGDALRGDTYNQRVETRALQAGAAWQIVALGPIGLSFNALWTHDAPPAKRAAAELDRLSGELPSFRHEARRARATYLVLTGRYHEAIELMRASDEPVRVAGWSRGQGVLARAHNRIGEHARARELCQAALAGKPDEDLSFVLMNLHLQIELVLAEAALGNFQVARELCDRMLARHAAVGPIALGGVHETRARIALLERDFATCRVHCAAMKNCYGATDSRSLRELSDRLIERLESTERGGSESAAVAPAALLGDDAHLMTRMRLILTHNDASFERRAQLGLQIALELTGAQDGFVLSRAANGGIVGTGAAIPPSELVQWAHQQLDATRDDATALLLPDRTLGDTALLTLGDHRYCVIPFGTDDHIEGITLALVLGFRGLTPRAPSAEVLATLAQHLVDAQATQQA